jgi:citrate synthase
MSCTSEITFIDGGKGILQYRGIPIEQLAEKSSFLEVAYLLINGNLPNAQQLEIWENKINKHSCLNQDLGELMKQFRYDAHPMGMLISTMAAYSTLHPEANPALSGQGIYKNEGLVNKQIYRIVGTITTICANAYRSRIGRDFNLPDNKLNYVENFLAMLDRLGNEKLKPHPTIARAMNILFILHADHEQNCSTAAIRHLTSSGVDVYSAISGAIAALYGPSHGGANEAVIRMLEEIGSVDKIPEFIKDVKDKKRRLMGFGHRVYKNYDPRARIIKRVAEEVFEVVGKEPLIEIAVKLEEIALSDEYFIKKKLYPNVDFYSGIIYKALGFPTDMFPVLFTIPRVVGWLAHWKEFINDPDFKIVRPRQNYVGELNKNYVEIENRPFINVNLDCPSSAVSKRREKSLIE